MTPVVSNSFLFHTLQKLISTDMLSLASDCNSLNTQLNLFSFMCCLGTFQFVFYKIAIFSVLLCNMTFVYVQSIYCRLLFCYLVIFIVFSSVIKYQNGMYNSMKLFNEKKMRISFSCLKEINYPTISSICKNRNCMC